MNKPLNLIGSKIRALRTEQGWSQSELAAQCQRHGWDVSREIVNRIEMQIRLVREYELVALAKVFKTSPLALLPKESEAFKRLSN